MQGAPRSAYADPRDFAMVSVKAIRELGYEAAFLLATFDAQWASPTDSPEAISEAIHLSLREVRAGLRRLREKGLL